MPMGIRRVEHKEEEVTMTSAAEIQAQERGEAQVEDDESSDDLFVDQGRTRDEAAGHARTNVKSEDETGGAMDLDEIPEGDGGSLKTLNSPGQKKKDGILQDAAHDQKHRKRKGALVDPEDELVAQDLARLVELFSIGGADAEKKDVAEGVGSALEGHMFLFQFPPVLAPLKSTSPETRSSRVKPEPDEEVVMLDQPKNGAAASARIDLTDDDHKVKAERANDDGGGADGDGEGTSGAQMQKEGGFVGHLVVRRSGKVELSWGGNKLVLAPGTQTNFLSQAVLLEEVDSKPQPGQAGGAAYGMGKIQGSFALVPTWGEEEEWEVDPDDLVIPDS